MAAYRLQFLQAAKTEWDKLDDTVQLQFTKGLAKRLVTPRVPHAALAGMPDCYKIKLRAVGYRLVYQVRDQTVACLQLLCASACAMPSTMWRSRACRYRAPTPIPAPIPVRRRRGNS